MNKYWFFRFKRVQSWPFLRCHKAWFEIFQILHPQSCSNLNFVEEWFDLGIRITFFFWGKAFLYHSLRMKVSSMHLHNGIWLIGKGWWWHLQTLWIHPIITEYIFAQIKHLVFYIGKQYFLPKVDVCVTLYHFLLEAIHRVCLISTETEFSMSMKYVHEDFFASM